MQRVLRASDYDREDHATGTDRLQEVAQYLALPDDHIVVNVQGDEPFIPPLINQVAHNLQAVRHASIATLAEPIDDIEQVFDANAVKVVRNAANMAMYFSRAPLPWNRSWHKTMTKQVQKHAYLRHIGFTPIEWLFTPLCDTGHRQIMRLLKALSNLEHCIMEKVCMWI